MAAQAKPPRSGVLQLFKCATRQDPTGSLLRGTRENGLQRPRTNWGVEHTGRNQPRTAEARAHATVLYAAHGSWRNIRLSR
jgi:hypothetical protein